MDFPGTCYFCPVGILFLPLLKASWCISPPRGKEVQLVSLEHWQCHFLETLYPGNWTGSLGRKCSSSSGRMEQPFGSDHSGTLDTSFHFPAPSEISVHAHWFLGVCVGGSKLLFQADYMRGTKVLWWFGLWSIFYTVGLQCCNPAQLKYQTVFVSYLKGLTPASLFTVLALVQPLLVALMCDESRTLCTDLSIQSGEGCDSGALRKDWHSWELAFKVL